ncbi:MAG: DNA polymerase III subunit alpha, partial [Deltaproteobacteria bacterium]
SMGITDLDPVKYGLFFERFLNVERVSLPDIDVDFCMSRRDEVIEYVTEKYGGEDHVAQIITFGQMKARAVIRDVGRGLGMSYQEVDKIAKLVPEKLNISLDEAIRLEPKLREMSEKDEQVARLLTIARALEGLPRHSSTHAAGVVISDKPMVEYLPLTKGQDGETVTQFDMKDVEKVGLIKFDFLGLKTLTVIDTALKLIERHYGERLDLSTIPLDDPKTFELLQKGDTTGVFQLESTGMKDLIRRLKPTSFTDLIALVALYRPGPLESGMVDDFVERKHGRKTVEYLVPELEPVLKSTYGVIVYQEQVMKIASVLASYEMAEADDLRKAMGKKIKSILAEHRSRFVDGAIRNHISREKAETIFDLIEKFGSYGFNKSHSAAYALITYQTAYLKAHFPVEMLAALLTSAMHSTEGVVKFTAECQRQGIEVLPPDINKSETTFTVEGGKIRFGLVAVKNVGEGAIEAMIAERSEKGPFSSLFDFCERMDLTKSNKRVIESLIKSGAFDSTGELRSRMMASLDDAVEYGQRIQREKNNPQMGLFDFMDDEASVSNYPPVPQVDEWELREKLALEKESLGFYISGHPLDTYRETVEKYSDVDTLSLPEKKNGQTVRVGGIISGVKEITSKNGRMAFVSLEDINGVIEVIVFSRLYSEVAPLIRDGRVIFVEGEVQKRETDVKILAGSVIPIEIAEETWTASVHISLDINRADRKLFEALRHILADHPGSCPGYLHLIDGSLTETVIALPDSLKVAAGARLNRAVGDFLGFDTIQTTIRPVVARERKKKRYIRRVK